MTNQLAAEADEQQSEARTVLVALTSERDALMQQRSKLAGNVEGQQGEHEKVGDYARSLLRSAIPIVR